IINCVSPHFNFNWRTQSIPLIPGRLISINTTSGFVTGKFSSAISALGYTSSQLKPSLRFISICNPTRISLMSSTIATLIICKSGSVTNLSYCYDFLLNKKVLNRYAAIYKCAVSGRGNQQKFSVDLLYPVLHILQAV